MKEHEAAQTKEEQPTAPMQITLQTYLYAAGTAPAQTDADTLKNEIDMALKPTLLKSKVVQLLCRASDNVLQALRQKYEDWFKGVVNVLTKANLLEQALGAVDAFMGTELTDSDDLHQLIDILELDNVPTHEKPFSDRYLTELRACIKDMDMVGLMGLLLPLKSPRSVVQQIALRRQYKEKFSQSLLEDLMEATSHSAMVESLACGLVACDEHWLWARTLYEAMKGGWTGLGTDESTLTDALVLNRQNLKGLQTSYQNISRKKGEPETLKDAIREETSGKFQWFLLAMLD